MQTRHSPSFAELVALEGTYVRRHLHQGRDATPDDCRGLSAHSSRKDHDHHGTHVAERVVQDGEIDLAADLWLPDGVGRHNRASALVIAPPGSSVKEQIGANYGRRMADRGFVPLASDPPHEGKSGGSPRDLEDPATRVGDLCCGVDYLTVLDSVDAERIGIVGAAQAAGRR